MDKGAHADSERGRGKRHYRKLRLQVFQKKKFPHLGFGYFKFIYVQKKNNRCLVTKPGKPIKTAPDKLLGWLTFSLFVW